MVDMIPCVLNGEFPITLPKHRADRPEWYTKKGWEKERLQSIHTHVKKDDYFFYVGAEEGDMAALIQMWGARMVLFEPNDRVWPNIKAIWMANGLRDPICYPGFASNKTTDSTCYLHFPSCANGEIISNHAFKELCSPGKIPQVKIDDFPYVPDCISLDVEGSEWQVLRGAEKVLKERRPKIWLSLHPEFMFRIYGEYQYDLRKWIKDIGYKEELLSYEHEVHLYYTSS